MSAATINLAGQTAIVTGGARGIGAAISRALAAAGVRIVVCGRNGAALTQFRSETSGDIAVHECDIRDPRAITQLFTTARERFDRLDIMVNNAGIGLFGPCTDVSVDDWSQVMDTNARGTFFCTQAAFQWMQSTGGGRIINIGSVVSHKGYFEQAIYSASKHAMLGFTKAMAREGQPHHIRVSAICPGGVATELVKSARPDLDPTTMLQPDDVANAVLYLAQEPESCCTDVLNLRRRDSTPFG